MIGPLLRTGTLTEYHPVGAVGHPVYLAAAQLRAALARRLDPDLADSFAIPQRNEEGDTLDWYAPRPGPVVPWSAASPTERSAAQTQLLAHRARIDELARSLQSDPDRERQVFARLLAHVLSFPDESHVYLVGGRPVISFWGFVRDRDAIGSDPLIDLGRLAADPPTAAAETPQPPRRRPRWWPWVLLLLLAALLLLLWWLRGCEPVSPRSVQPAPEAMTPGPVDEPASPDAPTPPQDSLQTPDQVDSGSLLERTLIDRQTRLDTRTVTPAESVVVTGDDGRRLDGIQPDQPGEASATLDEAVSTATASGVQDLDSSTETPSTDLVDTATDTAGTGPNDETIAVEPGEPAAEASADSEMGADDQSATTVPDPETNAAEQATTPVPAESDSTAPLAEAETEPTSTSAEPEPAPDQVPTTTPATDATQAEEDSATGADAEPPSSPDAEGLATGTETEPPSSPDATEPVTPPAADQAPAGITATTTPTPTSDGTVGARPSAPAPALRELSSGWHTATSLQDPKTGLPIQMEYRSQDGAGQLRLKRHDGSLCQSPAAAAIDGGRLVIETREGIRCADGTSFGQPRIECTTGADGQPVCAGRYPDGTTFAIDVRGLPKTSQ